MKLAAVAMVILVLIPVITVPRALAEEVVELGIGIDRSKLIMLTTIALLFSDIPLEYVERCREKARLRIERKRAMGKQPSKWDKVLEYLLCGYTLT
jgi:hypothetical protein